MAKLSKELMVTELTKDFEKVVFQSEDCHAYYFDAINPDNNKPVEIKIVKDDSLLEFYQESKSYAIYYREEGTEDWYLFSHIEIKAEIVSEN